MELTSEMMKLLTTELKSNSCPELLHLNLRDNKMNNYSSQYLMDMLATRQWLLSTLDIGSIIYLYIYIYYIN